MKRAKDTNTAEGGLIIYEYNVSGERSFGCEMAFGDLDHLQARHIQKGHTITAVITNASLKGRANVVKDLHHVDHAMSHAHQHVREEQFLQIFLAGMQTVIGRR